MEGFRIMTTLFPESISPHLQHGEGYTGLGNIAKNAIRPWISPTTMSTALLKIELWTKENGALRESTYPRRNRLNLHELEFVNTKMAGAAQLLETDSRQNRPRYYPLSQNFLYFLFAAPVFIHVNNHCPVTPSPTL